MPAGAGGTVWVATRSRRGVASIEVRNTGPVVPADQVEPLFEPFRRAAGERTSSPQRGVGLGLSIVRAVAVAHGGSVRAAALPAGGLAVVVDLPAG